MDLQSIISNFFNISTSIVKLGKNSLASSRETREFFKKTSFKEKLGEKLGRVFGKNSGKTRGSMGKTRPSLIF
jgi:hypothetical protein